MLKTCYYVSACRKGSELLRKFVIMWHICYNIFVASFAMVKGGDIHGER